MQHSHFAISTNFLTRGPSVKAKLKNASRSSNRAIQTSQIKRSTIKFRRPGTFGSRWLPESWSKTSMWTIRPSFVLSKSSEKYGNWLDGSPTNSPITERVRIFTDLMQRNEQTRSWRISSLGMNHGFSSKTLKERRFGFRQVFHPKEYRKASTAKKQCGVCHLSSWLLLIVPSLKSSFRSRNDCAAFQPFSKC